MPLVEARQQGEGDEHSHHLQQSYGPRPVGRNNLLASQDDYGCVVVEKIQEQVPNVFSWALEGIPRPELRLLQSIGSFASPIVTGEPIRASSLLISEVKQAVCCDMPGLFSTILMMAKSWYMMGSLSITLQLVGADPLEPQFGPTAAHRRWHVDVSPQKSDERIWRMISVILGPGTEHTPNENVRRGQLKRYTELTSLGPRPSETSLKFLNDSILIKPNDYAQLPSNSLALWRGGVARGLVHRGPQSSSQRILLVATSEGFGAPSAEVSDIIAQAILASGHALYQTK